MRRRFSLGAYALCAVLLAFASAPRLATAAPKAKAHAAAPRKPTPKNPKKAAPEADATDSDAKSADDSAADKSVSEKPDKGDASTVKAAGTNATKTATPAVAGVTTKEDKSGVKTYKFGTIEVEGRMKSPQIIYFLRRVRAEFDAGALGHRSFMRELSDTRNNPSLR
ncbi:MAG TPA: hypothetical protein VGF76_16335 [Polyangiaceae bacterium]